MGIGTTIMSGFFSCILSRALLSSAASLHVWATSKPEAPPLLHGQYEAVFSCGEAAASPALATRCSREWAGARRNEVVPLVDAEDEKTLPVPSAAGSDVEDDEMVSFDWATIQGQDGVRDDGSFPLLSPTLLWAGPDEGDKEGGAELANRGGDAPTLYLGCMFCSDDADPIEGRNKDVMGAIAGLFM